MAPIKTSGRASWNSVAGTWPVQYTGIVDEHKTVRESAGVFDISHMGEFHVSSPFAKQFLNELLTNDVEKLATGQGQYTLMLNNEGGVIDDLILYRLKEDEYLLVVNAAKIAEDRKWIEERLKLPPGQGIFFSDRSDMYSAVALQGPRSLQVARALLGAGWPMPEHNHITAYSWNCQPILAARTGYTGEDGVELFFPSEIAEVLFTALLDAGQPLGPQAHRTRRARQPLRLEACLPLNGKRPLAAPHAARGRTRRVRLADQGRRFSREGNPAQTESQRRKRKARRLPPHPGRATAAPALRALRRRDARG